MTTFVSRIAARVSRMVRGLVRFVRHPIWHYSISDIAGCVYRDWYGIEGNATHILSCLLRENSTLLEIEFKSKDTGETYVTLECRIKPNNAYKQNQTQPKGTP